MVWTYQGDEEPTVRHGDDGDSQDIAASPNMVEGEWNVVPVQDNFKEKSGISTADTDTEVHVVLVSSSLRANHPKASSLPIESFTM